MTATLYALDITTSVKQMWVSWQESSCGSILNAHMKNDLDDLALPFAGRVIYEVLHMPPLSRYTLLDNNLHRHAARCHSVAKGVVKRVLCFQDAAAKGSVVLKR